MGSQEQDAAGRNAQLVRTLSVLRDLDRLGGVDLYELAERYGTTVRTIRRDLEALQEVGLPLVEEQDGKRKRWRVAFKDHLQQLSGLLDATHYLALRLAMGQGGPVRSASSVFAALEDLSTKIETVLGPAGRAQLAAIDACFHSYEKFAYRRSPPDVFWSLVQAIGERRICRVTYRAPRRRPYDTVFEILPLRIFAHHGAVYLMCNVVKHDTLATLNLQRLQSLKVLDKRGQPPAAFDPTTLENAAFGVYSGGDPTTYVLRFDAEVAPYIRERTWHPTQRLRELRGGGVELQFTCGESYEVSAWVASWREGVEVVKPASLRDELEQLGEWLSTTYRRRPKASAGARRQRSRRASRSAGTRGT
jgi:predicted DNA-binding transcriptional regulator YafY